MKNRILLSLLLCVYAATAAAPKPKAYLRINNSHYYVAVYPDPPLLNGSGTPVVQAALYKSGQLVTRSVAGPDQYGAPLTFAVSDLASIGGDPSELVVSILEYPTAGGHGSFSVGVGLEISPKLDSQSANCLPDFALELASDSTKDPPPDSVKDRFSALKAYLHDHAPTLLVESRTHKGTEPRGILFGKAFELPTVLTRCFQISPPPPSGAYDLKMTFPPEAPIELRPYILKTGLTLAAHDQAPGSVDDTAISKRSLEQNLDLGVQFGSSVEDQTDGTRKRTNKGTLDLRFAPLLNLLPTPAPGSTSLWFWTPFYVNARVSTGKIDKDTLAENRIVFGSQFELRHYTDSGTYPAFQRLIFGIKNASDRDFHQAEWKGNIEFQPVFSSLNHPLRWREQTEASQLDPDPDRDVKHIPAVSGFGGRVLPLVGVDIGRTWRNHQRLTAIERSEFVRRLYFGGTITLDVTRYLALSGQDILYVRGEDKADRLHNYLLASASVPLPAFSVGMAQSVFFSYERGGQPPFSTPDTNALKLGYRIQWNGWFGKLR
jgi:hypothetical protein